ncbi:MAG: SDR family NAD(P)-dependent oxidoreductase [Candidatus Nanopelagicales bacterium]
MACEDPVTIVTGAAQGIGLGIAQTLAEEGHRLILVDLRQEALRENMGRSFDSARTEVVAGDVTSTDVCKAAFDQAQRSFGRIDGLVNNAGRVVFKSIADHSLDEWDSVLDTNLKATFIWCQEAIARMQPFGSGAIVNIASIAAFHYTTIHAPYAASKAGVVALTRDLAYEAGPLGIRVNAVAPGPIETPLTKEQLYAAGRAGYDQAIRLGRWGTPSDIADVVSFLLSSKAGFVTGVTIPVAGGADLRVGGA